MKGSHICGDVERRRERLSGVRDLGPVERNWNEAESRVHLQGRFSLSEGMLGGRRYRLYTVKLTPNTVLTFWLFGAM